MNEDMRELAALSALGAISPTDAAKLASGVAADSALARELALDRSAVLQLDLVAARAVTPPAALADRIVAAATGVSDRATSHPAPTAPRPRRRRWTPVVGAGIAAAAAIVALILVTTRDNGLGKPEIQSAIIPSSGQVQITGKASLYKPARPDGRVVLDVAGLPVTPAGHHYEVWVLRSGDTSMEAVGAFATDRTAPLHLDLRLPGGGRYAALDISIEDNGGPPEHSGKSVAGAKFGT